MKAFVKDDMIIHITERGDTEIGRIPVEKRQVGLERLRFDGIKIVDLMDLSEIWVAWNGYVYILHAIHVPGAQKVAMRYQDRGRLCHDPETNLIRLKTDEEVQDEKDERKKKQKEVKLRKKLGDIHNQVADSHKLINLVIMALIGKDSQAKKILNNVYDDIAATYPLDDLEKHVKDAAKKRKNAVNEDLA